MANCVSTKDRTQKKKATQNEVLLENSQLIASEQSPYYDHQNIADMCARFITHLFLPWEPSPKGNGPTMKLPCFIAYALRRAKLDRSVPFAALMLLQRLKAHFPTARAASGHRLFIAAFMIASKVIIDGTYSNKSWAIVARNMFSLRELNQMERDMCKRLGWELSIDGAMWANFETHIIKYFSQARASYPDYPLVQISKLAARAAVSVATLSLTVVSPARSSPPPPPPVLSEGGNTCVRRGSGRATPQGSSLTNASRTASVSPRAQSASEDESAHTRNVDPPTSFTHIDQTSPVHPLKGQMFAFAVPSKY